MITKLVDEYGPVALWSKRSAEGMRLLRQIGADEVIHGVYASTPGQLDAVLACLKGTVSPSALDAAAFITGSHSGDISTVANLATSSGSAGPSRSTIPKKRKAPLPDPADVIEISD